MAGDRSLLINAGIGLFLVIGYHAGYLTYEETVVWLLLYVIIHLTDIGINGIGDER